MNKMKQMLNSKRLITLSLIISLCFSMFFAFNPNYIFFGNSPTGKDNRSLTIQPSISSVHSIEWNKTWGASNYESGFGIALDSSENIYVAGYTSSYGTGSSDICFVKYNSTGVAQWYRTWGGTYIEHGQGIAIDSNNNIYVAGHTWTFGAGYYDICFTKYDSSGQQQWYKTWGSGTDYEYGQGIAIDSDNNVYIAGYTRSFGAGDFDCCLLKYNSAGVQQWYRTWGGTNKDEGYAIAIDSNNSIYVVGYTESFGAGSGDVCIVKYNSSGVQQWYQTWGGVNNEYGQGIAVDSNNSIYVVGYTNSFGVGQKDISLVKYTSSGVQQWNRTWGGSDDDYGRAIALDSSSNIYLVGYTFSFGTGNSDMCLVKYDSSGVQQSNQTWGGTNDEEGYAIIIDSTNTIYLTGCTKSFGAGNCDIFILKIGVDSDEEGLTDWAEENVYLTDPNDIDSDNDGLTDYEEGKIYYTDPNDSDSDDDGLTDYEELITYSTNPNDPDSDDDGYTDAEEVAAGSDPNNMYDTPITMLQNIFYYVGIPIIIICVIIFAFVLRSRKKGKGKRIEAKKLKEEKREEAIEKRKIEEMRKKGKNVKVELEQKFPMIEQLIQDRNYPDAIKELEEIMDVAKTYYIDDIIEWTSKRLYICNTFDKIQNLFQISDRVKVEDLASGLGIDRGELFKKIGEWGKTFDFTIDGDYIKIKLENMGAFMDALDKSFEDWESPEKKSQKM